MTVPKLSPSATRDVVAKLAQLDRGHRGRYWTTREVQDALNHPEQGYVAAALTAAAQQHLAVSRGAGAGRSWRITDRGKQAL